MVSLLSLVAVSLVAAVIGGLLRAGVAWPALADGIAIGRAADAHAALVMCGFLGTMIAIERAVAIKLRSAFVAPAMSGLAGVLMLGGQAEVAAWLWAFAGLVFVGVNVVVVQRQPAPHTVLLLVGALAWLVGNLAFALGRAGSAVLPWWFAFLVLTIAAERLEMTRLMRRHALAQPSLHVILLVLVAGAGISGADTGLGGLVYGAALIALAAWLARFDIARRTALSHGLGFVFSMVMGHAPVILPAVARVKLLFGPWFYAPLVLLHGSLLLRLLGGLADPDLRSTGATLNAAALALFVLTAAGAALAWRLREASALSHTPHR